MNQFSSWATRTFPFHYGWLIVAGGTLCILASLGLGRFAIGMLLPAMQTSLGLTYAQMGYVGTGNFVGYLLAVLCCGYLVEPLGYRRLIAGSLVLVGVSMLLISRSSNFLSVFFLYMATGVGSGLSNVPMMALVSIWFEKTVRGRAAGFVVIGSGFAILLSGKLVPYLNSIYGEEGWQASWAVIGCIVLAASAICFFVLRDSPGQIGLQPVGLAVQKDGVEVDATDPPVSPPKSLFIRLSTLYFLFGFTYVIYATFVVTTLVQERGFSEVIAGNFWSIIGLCSLFSGPVFGTFSDRFGRKNGLMFVFFIQSLAYFFIAFPLPDIFLYASIGLYGLVAWSIPSIMAALVGDYYGTRKATRVFGMITFVFAVGQICGPAIAGFIAERGGGFSSAYMVSGILVTGAVLLAAGLKRPESYGHYAE